MGLKEGVYRKKEVIVSFEQHGGTQIKHKSFLFIAFYLFRNKVGIHIGNEFWLTPYLNRDFLYNGEITKTEGDEVWFFIDDTYLNDRIEFYGLVNGDIIHINSFRESCPEKIWIEDDFEYIGTGENETKI